jgi:hypothetical protein
MDSVVGIADEVLEGRSSCVRGSQHSNLRITVNRLTRHGQGATPFEWTAA